MTIRRDPRLFDKTRPLVMARFNSLYEHEMEAGDRLTIVEERGDAKGEVTLDIAIRLWLSGQANYESDWSPTPIETPEQEAERVVEIEPLPGGFYLIRAPWQEAEKIRGKANAEARRAEIVERGDTKGVTYVSGDDGWYEVSAPWLDEPEKVEGEEAAVKRADELIAQGHPEGWRLLTPEEKEAAAEQARLADEARRIADEEAEKGRLADEAAIEAAAARDGNELESVPFPASNVIITVDEGGLHTVVSPWTDAETFDTPEAAEARQAELRELGSPEGWTPSPEPVEDFEVLEAGSNGWFEIRGPGLEEPVKIRGKEAAEAKAAELREGQKSEA